MGEVWKARDTELDRVVRGMLSALPHAGPDYHGDGLNDFDRSFQLEEVLAVYVSHRLAALR